MSFKGYGILILIFTMLLLPSTFGCALTRTSSQGSSTSQMPEQEASLSGYVTDTSTNPLSGALVRVYFHGTFVENSSDMFGYYHVEHIPLCYCFKNATCSKPGYHTTWVLLSISENTTHNFSLTAQNQTCYPVFNGTIGTNGWYVSCVNISFRINGDVDTVFYKMDGDVWNQYTTPFQICSDGRHMFYWYYTYDNNTSAELLAMLSIDRTNPEVNVTIERIGINKFHCAINALDETSNINRIELLVDGVLYRIIDMVPYQGVITCFGNHHISIVVFDNAGNSVNSTFISSDCYVSSFRHQQFFLSQTLFVQQILLRIQNISTAIILLFSLAQDGTPSTSSRHFSQIQTML